tara:strand:+ start:1162 stop:2328 length:1167 start_codon:yes stop_codon:yes gene_type:complete
MKKTYLSWLLAGAAVFAAADASAAFKVVKPNPQRSYIDTNGVYVYSEGVASDNHSTVVTERVSTQRTVNAQIDLIHARLADRGMSGAAAGSKEGNLFSVSGSNAGGMDGANGLWANGRWDHIKDDTNGGKWDANLWSFALGYDHRFNQRFLAGLAVHYHYMRGDTSFNQGNIRDHGYGVTPYATFKVNDWLDLDAIFGYSRFTKNRTRTQMGSKPGSVSGVGQKVSGDPKSDRYFASLFANLTHRVQKWDFLGRLGYIHAQDNQKSFTESNGDQYDKLKTKLNRLSLRLQAGYKLNEMVSPYLFGLYVRDFTENKHGLLSSATDVAPGGTTTVAIVNPEENRSKNTWGAGLGLRFNSGKRLSGGLEYQYTANKKVKTNTVNVNVKYKF